MLRKLFDVMTLKVFAVTAQRKTLFIAAIIAVVLLSIFNQDIVKILNELPYIGKILEIVLFTLSMYIFASGFRIILVSRYRKKNELDSEEQDNFTIGASTLVGTITALGTIVWIFSVFEIEFFAFITSIALFSVALATIFKETIQDFIQGLSILFTANHKVGDYIQVASHPKGVIIDISLAKMKLKLEDGSVLHLSNHVVNSSPVINLSNVRFTKVTVAIPVPRETTFVDFQTMITNHLQTEFEGIVAPQRSTFLITATNESYYEVQCEIAVHKYSFTIERTMKNAVQTFTATLSG